MPDRAAGPLTTELSIGPIGTAIMKPATARARCLTRTGPPIQLAAGVRTASPAPMASSRLRLPVSASLPSGSPALRMFTRKKNGQ